MKSNDHASRIPGRESSHDDDPPDVTTTPQGGDELSLRALDERVRQLIARRRRQLAAERTDRRPG